MKIGIICSDNGVQLWHKKIGDSLLKEYPNCDIKYLAPKRKVSLKSKMRISGFVYNKLDSMYTGSLISPFLDTEAHFSPIEEEYDLIIDTSWNQKNSKLKSDRIIQIPIQQYTKQIIEAFKKEEDVVKLTISDSNNQIYTFVEGVDYLSVRKTLHNIFHRIHSDILSFINEENINYYCVEESKRPKKSTLYFTTKMINFVINRLRGKEWTWDVKLSSYKNTTIIKPLKNIFYADPFVVEDENGTYIFLEKMNFSKGIAHLVVKTSDDNFDKDYVILDKNYHLSYPHIFVYKGIWYMIPETSANKTVDLYESTNFPFEWKYKKKLLEGDYVDATVLIKDSRCLLFCSTKIDVESTTYSRSCIFESGDLLDEEFEMWGTHLIDSRYARQGGAFIIEDNKLYRVAQDNSKSYGRAVHIFEVKSLVKNDYQELLYKTISADSEYMGIHTYNKYGNNTVTDYIYLG